MSYPLNRLDYSTFILLPCARNARPGMRMMSSDRDSPNSVGSATQPSSVAKARARTMPRISLEDRSISNPEYPQRKYYTSRKNDHYRQSAWPEMPLNYSRRHEMMRYRGGYFRDQQYEYQRNMRLMRGQM